MGGFDVNEWNDNGWIRSKVTCEDFLSFLHDSCSMVPEITKPRGSTLLNGNFQGLLTARLRTINASILAFARLTVGRISGRYFRIWKHLGLCPRAIISNIGGCWPSTSGTLSFYHDWTAQIGANKNHRFKLVKTSNLPVVHLIFAGLATQIMPIGADIQSEHPDEDQSPDVTRRTVDHLAHQQ